MWLKATQLLGKALKVSSLYFMLVVVVIVLPLVTANWKFAENWQLKAGFIDVATLGYGASVA